MRVITMTNGRCDLGGEDVINAPPQDDGYVCACHRLLGNDFYFLPMDACINGQRGVKQPPCEAKKDWAANGAPRE